MLESNLLGGAQDYRARPLVYGRSITDPCLSFEKTDSRAGRTGRGRAGAAGAEMTTAAAIVARPAPHAQSARH